MLQSYIPRGIKRHKSSKSNSRQIFSQDHKYTTSTECIGISVLGSLSVLDGNAMHTQNFESYVQSSDNKQSISLVFPVFLTG